MSINLFASEPTTVMVAAPARTEISTPLAGRVAAVQQGGNNSEAGQHDHVSQLSDAAGLGERHMNQVFDDGDIGWQAAGRTKIP